MNPNDKIYVAGPYGRRVAVVDCAGDAVAAVVELGSPVYTLAYIPTDLIGGLFIALLMNQRIRGISVLRTIFYLPTVLSGVAFVAVSEKMIVWFGLEHDAEHGVAVDGLRLLHEPVVVVVGQAVDDEVGDGPRQLLRGLPAGLTQPPHGKVGQHGEQQEREEDARQHGADGDIGQRRERVVCHAAAFAPTAGHSTGTRHRRASDGDRGGPLAAGVIAFLPDPPVSHGLALAKPRTSPRRHSNSTEQSRNSTSSRSRSMASITFCSMA